MSFATLDEQKVLLTLTRPEALVFFEWLSRNWEQTSWEDGRLFQHVAEKQVLIDFEGALQKVLPEPFDEKYADLLSQCYRDVVASTS